MQTQATIRILGENIEPEKIGPLLGIEHAKIYKKGDLIEHSQESRHQINGWYFVLPLQPQLRIEEQLEVFVRNLLPKKEIFTTLLSKPGNVGEIFIGSHEGPSGYSTLYFTYEFLQNLGSLKLNLNLDFYP